MLEDKSDWKFVSQGVT